MGGITFRIESWEVLGPLLLAFGAVLAVRARRGEPGWHGVPALTRLLAAVYVAGFAHFTFFPIIVDRSQNLSPWYEQTQPIPFLGLLSLDPGFVLNVFLFAPLGMVLLLMTRGDLSPKRVALRCLAVSAAVEITQLVMYILFSNGRSADADDLVANTLGGVLGFLVLRLALRSTALSRIVRPFALPGTALAGSAPETRVPTADSVSR
ncbi:VanZ family protein [Streptomyces sp. NBC_00005]|uniref:VanZ family protein n=1 Tax=Streptomyces sp. NBC_00005 TaxID=2903609 RepID=UPI0032502102